MNLYNKLRIENQYNTENLEKIDTAAAAAIDYGVKYYEHAVSNTWLTDEGFIRLEFVEGQEVDKEMEEYEAQKNFDEKFAEVIDFEYPEVK